MKVVVFLNTLIFSRLVFGDDVATEYCSPRSRLIRSKRDAEFVIVEVQRGEAVQMLCSFCDKLGSREPRVWVSWNLTTGLKQEVKFGSRFSETALRAFVVQNVSETDAAIYLCQLPYEDSLEESFSYLLDVVESRKNVTMYSPEDMQNITNSIDSQLSDFVFLLDPRHFVRFKIVPGWSPWTQCQECISNPLQSRMVRCRLKLSLVENYSMPLNVSKIYEQGSRAIEILLEAEAEIPCTGQVLKNILPELASLLETFPDFLQMVPCEPSCPLRGGKSGPKERKMQVLDEGARAFVTCPGLMYGDTFRWEYNKRRLSSQEFDGMVSVDHFGGLHLVDVDTSCKGNYTCIVTRDGKEIRLLEIKLIIVPSRMREWAAFKRHAGYLAIVCLLSLVSFSIALSIFYLKKKKEESSKMRNYRSVSLLGNEESDSEFETEFEEFENSSYWSSDYGESRDSGNKNSEFYDSA